MIFKFLFMLKTGRQLMVNIFDNEHSREIIDAIRRMYHVSCVMAIRNSNQLRAAVERNENTNRNPTVQVAIEQHQNDLESFRRCEVSVDVPLQSFVRVRQSIEQAEPDRQSNLLEDVDNTWRSWQIAAALGAILVGVLAVVRKLAGGHWSINNEKLWSIYSLKRNHVFI